MNFWAWGPFEYNDSDQCRNGIFWDAVDLQAERYNYSGSDLRSAIGCYMFATKRGGRYKPWYIGKTLAQTGFRREIFTDHKLKHYRAAMTSARADRGFVTLFSLVTDSNRMSKGYISSRPVVDWLEKYLIGMALAKNRDLRNLRDTKFLKSVWVDGLMGTQPRGKPFTATQAARNALL